MEQCFAATNKRPAIAVALLAAILSVGPAIAASADENIGTQLSVFVPDSSVAAERFTLAEKLEKASEWSKAAEVYQELLDQYRDRVVPAGSGPEDAGLYVSVADRATRQLAAWPVDGLAAYNGRFQPAAEALLQSASSASSLRTVVDRYALTRGRPDRRRATHPAAVGCRRTSVGRPAGRASGLAAAG